MLAKIIAIVAIYIVAFMQGVESVVAFLFKGWTFNLLDGIVLAVCLTVVVVGVVVDERKRRKA